MPKPKGHRPKLGCGHIYQAKPKFHCYNWCSFPTKSHPNLKTLYRLWVLIVGFSYDVCVMILLRIRSSKIITETWYLKPTIKPHKLHYKYLLGSGVEGTAAWTTRKLLQKYHIQNSQLIKSLSLTINKVFNQSFNAIP